MDHFRHAPDFHPDLSSRHPRAFEDIGNPGACVSNEGAPHVGLQVLRFETSLQGWNGMGDDQASLKIRSEVRRPLQDHVALGSQIDSADDCPGRDGGCRTPVRHV